jgi:hypothetical protein
VTGIPPGRYVFGVIEIRPGDTVRGVAVVFTDREE